MVSSIDRQNMKDISSTATASTISTSLCRAIENLPDFLLKPRESRAKNYLYPYPWPCPPGPPAPEATGGPCCC